MKKAMKKAIIVITVLIVLGAFILRDQIKRATTELDYGIAPGLKLQGVSFGLTKLVVPFWINNPTMFNLTISNLRLEVFVNNVFAGRITLDGAYRLNKNEKSIVSFTIDINNVSAMDIFINVNQYLQSNNWRDKINISVRGVGRIESGVVYVSNVPIKADGTYKYWMG